MFCVGVNVLVNALEAGMREIFLIRRACFQGSDGAKARPDFRHHHDDEESLRASLAMYVPTTRLNHPPLIFVGFVEQKKGGWILVLTRREAAMTPAVSWTWTPCWPPSIFRIRIILAFRHLRTTTMKHKRVLRELLPADPPIQMLWMSNSFNRCKTVTVMTMIASRALDCFKNNCRETKDSSTSRSSHHFSHRRTFLQLKQQTVRNPLVQR